MNDICNSPAFQEFLQKRCEEIAMKDKEYVKINELILSMENEIKVLVSDELLKKLNKYEKLNLDLMARAETLFYSQAIKDFKIGG